MSAVESPAPAVVLENGKCFVCQKPRGHNHHDPFCSAGCAREYYGVAEPVGLIGVSVGTGRGVKKRKKREGHNFSHGLSGYKNYGCRCEVCTAANTQAARLKKRKGKKVW